MPEQPFILGVNYWPRRKAMYWWSDFDLGEVKEEFSLIQEIGLNLVRIFLLWDDWQPTPEAISLQALKNLEKVCAVAAALGLQLDITFFTGHMSGPNWAPGWLLRKSLPLPPGVNQLVSGGKVVNCGYANPFSDPQALEAEEVLLKSVVSALKGHPGVGIWNLGNEPDLFARPANAASGRAWVRRWTALIHQLDPGRPVTCGLHAPSLSEDNGLRIHDIFSEVDIPVIHGYPMYSWLANGPLDADFVPYLCALVSALCGKPTLAEEFGGPTGAPGKSSSTWKWNAYGRPRHQFVPGEEDFALYIEQVLPKLVEVGASGAALWCFADYIPELYNLPPCDESWHERFFGLVRSDGSLKPHAQALQRFAAARPKIRPALRKVALDITPEEYYQDPARHMQRLYGEFTRNSIRKAQL